MPDNVQNITEVPKPPKRKFDRKTVAKVAGATSAVVLVAVGAYKLGASGGEETLDEETATVEHDPTTGE